MVLAEPQPFIVDESGCDETEEMNQYPMMAVEHCAICGLNSEDADKLLLDTGFSQSYIFVCIKILIVFDLIYLQEKL